jgi:DNA-binding PadR family transcriptional regulator
MARGELLGSLEHIVLLAVARLGSDAYGMTVRQEILKRTGRDLSIGAVYATLERLEKKRYVSSSIGERDRRTWRPRSPSGTSRSKRRAKRPWRRLRAPVGKWRWD